MKKIALFLVMAIFAVGMANAKAANQLKIYINPGHGNWSNNDRPMALVNKSIKDTTGFYESNTNIRKGLALYHKLRSYGLVANGNGRDLSQNIVMSHVRCNPSTSDIDTGNTYDGTYSRALSVIAGEADTYGADMFISVHSNANLVDGDGINYPLILYRGTDSAESVSGSKAMGRAVWPYAYGNNNQVWSGYSLTNMNIRGDVSFMGSGTTTSNSAGNSYYGYYGVLKHNIPGFLIEGFFHTYQPSRHRAMNWDVDYIEGYSYARGIADYFGVAKESTGDIYGLVRSADESSSSLSPYTANSSSDDVYLPLNGATVTLKNSGGTTVGTYTTDGFYNGAFVFKDIAPGTYTVTASKSGYVSQTKTVVVTAATTNYCNFTDGTHNFKLSIDTGGGGGGGGSATVDYTGMTTHNPFAYDVTTYTAPRGVSVSYKLTGRPTSVVVELYKDNNLVKSVNGNITAGTNTVFIPMVGLVAGTYKAKVKVTGNAVTSPTRVKDGNNNEISYRFYAPWGVSCNNYTDSRDFGMVVVTESHLLGSTISSTEQSRIKNYHSVTPSYGGTGNGIGMGIYQFTPTFTPIANSNGTYGSMCGMTAVTAAQCASKTDIKRIKYTDDGRLFVCRNNNCNSSVWEIYADWRAQEFFGRESMHGVYHNTADSEAGGGRRYTSDGTFIAGPAFGFDFIGSGSNLKMIVVSQNLSGSGASTYNQNRSRVDIYNIGTFSENPYWVKAPSLSVTSKYWVALGNDVACGNTHFYVSQYRTAENLSENTPAHVGYSYSGTQDTKNITMVSPNAAMAFDKTHTRLAKNNGSSSIGIYTPQSDGMLGSAAYSISFPSTSVSALAWDYADNLYATTNGGEYVICYAIPRSNNTVTTPARSAYDINWTDADVYLLGNYEGKSFLPSNGTKMNYNSTSKTYTLEGNLTNSGDGYAYFSFSHVLSSSWDQTMADNRFGAEADGNFVVYDQYLDTPLSLKYWANDSRAFKIPPGNYRLVVNFTDSDNPKLTITKLSYDIEAWQPSANYTVDAPQLLGTRSCDDYNASIGVSNGLIYTMHQYINGYAQSNFRGFLGGINRNKVDFTAVQSSNVSGTEIYMTDRCTSSDDAGNIVMGAVRKTDSGANSEMRATGLGQGLDRFMIIPANGGGIGNTSVAANQSVTFGISGSAIPDRTQLIRASGDFSSSQGGYIWALPHDASVIWRGGYKNVTTSGGTAIDGTLIYTGFTSTSSALHSANPYGEDGLMLSVRDRGICDGKIVGSRYQSNIVSSNSRHTHGHPSMFIIQDHKLLVCCTGSSGTDSMGLFDISNDANGTYSMAQIGSDFAPFSTSVAGTVLGNTTKAIPVDDLTWDLYSLSGNVGFAVYRIHLSPVPVTAGSGSVSNNGTSQSKTITWTKGSGTTPVGYNVEVSTDGGTTWTMAASADDVTTETWTDTDTSRATLDCKYRVSAVYDSYTSTERHASAPCAVITVNAQRPTKAVGGVVVTFNPLIGTSTYNSTADLVGLEGSLSWTRPKSIASDSQTFPATATGDYGFGITGYRITVVGSDGLYATDESGNSLNAFTVAATGAMAGDNLSMTLKNVKRGVTYTATVEPVYSYLPTSAASYGTSASAGNTWSYTPEAVQNFTVNTYVQRNAPFNEWWTDHTQTVYYDIYRVEITLDGPAAAGVPVSYYKLEVSRNNGSTWEPITDRPYEVASGQSGATSATYPSYDGVPAGCWHGNHDFSVRTKPDAGFANNVNVGFYHFVVKGLSPAAPYSISPRAAEDPTPDEWQYRVTTYYGSSPSAIYDGQVIEPDISGAGSSSSVVITEVSDPTITSVEPVGIQPIAVKVYPNPTQGALNILSPESIETIRIVSVGGALMRSFDGNRLNSQTIDISDLGRGNYIVIVNALKPVVVIRN